MKIKTLFLLFVGFAFLVITNLGAEAKWTVLVYMAADNSLSQASFKDINEMEAVEYNDSVNVIVQVDPNSNTYYPPYFTTCRRFKITHDTNPDSIESELLSDLGEINSADPEEVTEFANWGFSAYPSQKTMLILWDHGNGWLKKGEEFATKSICNDNSNGGTIGVANGELNQAISGIDHEINILDFDACKMQMVEVIAEVYEYCDFIVGSELNVPGDGLFYGANPDSPAAECGLFNYLTTNPLATPEEVSFEMVTGYVNSYTLNYQSSWSEVSLSAVSTQTYSAFMDTLYNFCDAYSDTIYHSIYEDVYDECYSIGNESLDINDFFTNLSDYASGSLSTSAIEISNLIDTMKIHSLVAFDNGNQPPNIGFGAIHYPFQSYNFNWEKYSQLKFVRNTGWDGFLAFYFQEYSENGYPKINFFNISSYNDLVTFSWDATAPTFMNVKYSLESYNFQDSIYTSLLDSAFTSAHHFQTNLDYGNYEFKLTAIDEFGNSTDSTKTKILAAEKTFKFFPNPYNVSETEQDGNGKFIFSTEEGENAVVYIYNFAGDLIKKLTPMSNEPGVKIIDLDANKLASGIYFCVLRSGENSERLKLAIIR